jgi:ribosomal protein S18 acetylase RimI-like enzyme
MHAVWKPMLAAHLIQVEAMAAAVHLDYPEDPEVFADRLRLFPEGCFVAQASGSDALVGYSLSHPGELFRPPPLNSLLGALPQKSDCLYLHDVALLSTARGLGLGRALVKRLELIARARGLGPLALTAVNASVRYWHGHGFDVIDPPAALAEKLRSYGDDAAYMVRPFGG